MALRQDDTPDSNDVDQSIDLEGSISIAEVRAEDIDEEALGVRGIPLDKIERGKKLIVDLYLPRYSRKADQIVMHRILKAGKPLRAGEFNFLRNYGLDVVYVPLAQMPQFLEEAAKNTRKVLTNPLATTDAKAELLRENATWVVEHAMDDPRLGDNIEIGRELIMAVADFLKDTPDSIQSLIDVLTVDYSLLSHSVNVCLLIVAFGYFLGLTKHQITQIGLGGLFHDVGKRNLPEAILKKPTKLLEDEWALMRNHPTEGFQMLRESGKLPAESLKMVYQHHENIDGSGYPRGLTGDQIATQSQIIRIADAYDAITSERVYKPASSPSEAIRIISHEMNGQFNELLLQSFVRFLGRVGGKKRLPVRPGPHP